jgi:hypothetical protein
MDCDLTDGDRGRCSYHGFYCTSPVARCICDADWTGTEFELGLSAQNKLSQSIFPALSQVSEILQPWMG